MKTVEIVFTKSKKKLPIVSWFIMLWTRKNYSHVARHKVILGESMYYQASDGKVNYENVLVFDKKHEIVKSITLEVPEEIERLMSIECLKSAGQKYATMQNLGIVLVDLLTIFKIRASNPWKKGSNCSEILYKTILKFIYPHLDYNPDTIKPHHIERILNNQIKLTTKYMKTEGDDV